MGSKTNNFVHCMFFSRVGEGKVKKDIGVQIPGDRRWLIKRTEGIHITGNYSVSDPDL